MNSAILIPLIPFLGFALNGLVGHRLSRALSNFIACSTIASSFALSLVWFIRVLENPQHRFDLMIGQWIAVDYLQIPFAFVIDALSSIMLLVITGIGLLIHIYSIGYMHHEKATARFFAYLNLFVFFMTLLVMSSSLPLLFVGWEGVGLCSYLLIGYYFETEEAPRAGLKAFLYNRVGDVGVLLGMMILFLVFKTLTISDLLQQVSQRGVEHYFGWLTFATLMLFLGCTGKSAQIPLYLWLPDAMAGPTPVSALIHAATMVTSGIYLVCRLAPLFVLAPHTLHLIAWIGVLTALFAATMALFQKDIKKVLAYSTVSQLGFMFLGLGVTGFSAGFFHVFTHAWFKALLFLGAGSVIVALHHEQDIFKMGGLRKKLPITFYTMLIGALCLMGFPGTSGFASKDEILYLTYLHSPMLWSLGVLAAVCTAFYTTRLMVLVFAGQPRDLNIFDHAHESPWWMTIPLILLSLGALVAVMFGWPEAFGGHNRIASWLQSAIHYAQSIQPEVHELHIGLAWKLAIITTVASLLSAGLAWKLYAQGLEWEQKFEKKCLHTYRILREKYYVDQAVQTLIINPFFRLGQVFWKLGDVILIDGIGVNLPGAVTHVMGDLGSHLQTGRLRNYTLLSLLGLLGLLVLLWSGRT